MSDKAVLEVIKNQTRDYNKLLKDFNNLMIVHTKTVNDFAELDLKAYELRKQNKDLRVIVVRWERDNKRLQESLDEAQREIERLSEEWELVVRRDLG